MLAGEQIRLRRPDVPWLIPVRLDDCEIPHLDLGGGRSLASIHHADLFGASAQDAQVRLVETVLNLLGKGDDGLSGNLLSRADKLHTDVVSGALRASTASDSVFPKRVEETKPPGPVVLWVHGGERPENFSGRSQEFRQLARWFSDRSVHVIGLTAWGGAGKTALITEYIRTRDSNTERLFQGVFA